MRLISLLQALFSVRALTLAAWGALGGLIGFALSEPLAWLVHLDGHHQEVGRLAGIGLTAVWTALAGVGIGATTLAGDNQLNIRGQWHRDFKTALPLFLVLGALSGGLAQAFFEPALGWLGVNTKPNPLNPAEVLLNFILISFVRAVAWALLGAGLGLGIGLLRRDWKAALRGALGGVIGGYHGGESFDFVAAMFRLESGAVSRAFGLILTGAAIAWCMRVAQEALRSAWLLGVTTGPYEGKECALNTARVSVGRAETNDLALLRDETVPAHLGDFVYHDGGWWWEGEPALVNGVPQTRAPLPTDAIIQLGTYGFKFLNRSRSSVRVRPPLPPLIPSTSSTAFPIRPTAADEPDVPLPPMPSASGITPPRVPPRTMPPTVPPTNTPPQVTAQTSPPVSSTPRRGAASVTPTVPPVVSTTPGQLLVLTPLDALYRPYSLGGATQATVGRGAANDWTIAHDTVSSQHALLSLQGNVLVVTDQDSTNGTFFNGAALVALAPTPLKEGDRVRFGGVECFVSRR